MLEGKTVQPSQTSVDLDFDLEEEREKIRAELRKEFEEQIKSQNQKQGIQSAETGAQSKKSESNRTHENSLMSHEVMQDQHIDSIEPKLISDTETSHAIVNEIDTANAIQKLQVSFIRQKRPGLKFPILDKNYIQAKLLVGGENLNNEEVKERKKKRKKHADKKRNEIKRMAEAVRLTKVLIVTDDL